MGNEISVNPSSYKYIKVSKAKKIKKEVVKENHKNKIQCGRCNRYIDKQEKKEEMRFVKFKRRGDVVSLFDFPMLSTQKLDDAFNEDDEVCLICKDCHDTMTENDVISERDEFI